jgi:hypothetical protein
MNLYSGRIRDVRLREHSEDIYCEPPLHDALELGTDCHKERVRGLSIQ